MYLFIDPTKLGRIIEVGPGLVIEIPDHAVGTALYLTTARRITESGRPVDTVSLKGLFVGGKGGLTLT